MSMSNRSVPHDNDEVSLGLVDLVRQYFEVVFTNNLTLFDKTFHERAQLSGIAGGALVVWSAQQYREVLEKRASPKSLGAPREEQILQLDLASSTHGLAKVQVRVNQTVFIDYLTMLRLDGEGWKIMSKTFVGSPAITPLNAT
jgi:Putative lumazine-binding